MPGVDEKIVSLAKKRREPRQDVIDLLEKWLAQAKRGELRGVCIQGLLDGGEFDAHRYGSAGAISEMMAASLCEQQATLFRMSLAGRLEDVEDSDDDGPESDS